MQIERLFGIVFMLLDQKRATAAQLAERFGVSVRTIYRDIDTLSLAGIPVYSLKGKNGGISLMEDFVMDKSIFSQQEQAELLSILQGTAAVQPGEAAGLFLKMRGLFQKQAPDWIEIDYSDWSGMQAEIFSTLKAAILQCRVLSFEYVNSRGEKRKRRAEPLKLYFKHQAWYLWAFCLEKSELRMFKLSRMKELKLTGDRFLFRDMEQQENTQLQNTQLPDSSVMVQMLFWIDPALSYRVYDEFQPEQIEEQPDGSFLIRTAYPMGEWVYSFVQSFGMYGEVISPAWLRAELKRRLQKALTRYQEPSISNAE